MAEKVHKKKILIGITGASGMLFVKAFLNAMKSEDVIIHGICSTSGEKVLRLEEGLNFKDLPGVSRWFDEKDFSAPPASGSAGYEGMVILPCTMGSLAAIANGMSINLMHRAADVILKEKRTLLLCVRETPFNRNHLQNMLKAHDSGAVIMPPMPAYYFKPQTMNEAAETFGWRVAEKLGVSVKNVKQWVGDDANV